MASEPTLASLAAEAERQGDIFDGENENGDNSAAARKRQYIRTLHKVIDEADVIMLVLDARDPFGCRSRLVEEEVRRREADGKRLVFVLNKIGINTAR